MASHTSNDDVAVVIPALNEGPVIQGVVAALRKDFRRIIVVDDGSGDGTAELARESGAQVIQHLLNLGQGSALRTGIDAALRMLEVEWIITFDADGQHRPEDAGALMDRARVGDVDVILGTRFGSGPVEAGTVKRLTLRVAVAYTRATTGLPLTDTHNGLRAMSRAFAQSLTIQEHGMAHATEILHHVARSGARWAEIPVHIRYTDYSRAKGQPIINSVNILFDSLFR